MSSILFSGGCTGGHLFPGIAVAEALTGVVARIGFVGQGTELERRESEGRGFDYFQVPSVSMVDLRRRPIRSTVAGWAAYRAARRIVAEFSPSAVVGLGGFSSAPAVLAASQMGVPVTLLEQNVIPGRATRFLSRLAKRVCIAFAETEAGLPSSVECRLTGNPIRRLSSETDVEETVDRRRVLLVLGGSQGAQSLNRTVPEALAAIRPQSARWRVVHQCGGQNPGGVREAYRLAGWSAVVEQFLDLPPRWLRQSDLVVARAGATTLAEIATAGRAVVLVPYPHAADDHQRANAEWFACRGAARMVLETNGRQRFLGGLVEEMDVLLGSSPSRWRLANAIQRLARPDAADAVLDVLGESLDGFAELKPMHRRAA